MSETILNDSKSKQFQRFEMEDLQSKWEKVVDYNLSESGVDPVSVSKLLEKSNQDPEDFLSTQLHYPPTQGTKELRRQITRFYPEAKVDNVSVTVGCAEANFNAIRALLNPGDELIVMIPNYMQIFGLGQNSGLDVKKFHLEEEQDWSPNLNELEEKVTEDTKCIAVCNPNNPTGYILTDEEMDRIVEIADSVGAWLLSDEVYSGAESEGDTETPSFWGRYDRVIANNSLSKAYGLPGLRIGWVVSHPEIIEEIEAQKSYTTICATVLSNKLATLALSPEVRPFLIQRTRDHVRDGYSDFREWIDSNGDVFSLVDPQAGAFGFPSFDLDISALDLVKRLIDEKSVLVVAGEHFGLNKKYLRISYGLPREELLAGLGRISELVDKLK
ncbi:MAG: aminotransferase class I/II-fold pyridoxal phosphate-dependent enzyme [Candidatus Bipolaricaulota bacterium]